MGHSGVDQLLELLFILNLFKQNILGHVLNLDQALLLPVFVIILNFDFEELELG